MTPEFKGTHLSGATHWVMARPIIQLSLRHKSDDQFWFSLFHEAGHILNAPRRRDYVDTVDVASDEGVDPDEAKANQFARDILLPPDAYAAFVGAGDFGEAAITEFSREQGIPAGVVLGRLQRDDKVSPASYLNRLKKPIRWAA